MSCDPSKAVVSCSNFYGVREEDIVWGKDLDNCCKLFDRHSQPDGYEYPDSKTCMAQGVSMQIQYPCTEDPNAKDCVVCPENYVNYPDYMNNPNSYDLLGKTWGKQKWYEL